MIFYHRVFLACKTISELFDFLFQISKYIRIKKIRNWNIQTVTKLFQSDNSRICAFPYNAFLIVDGATPILLPVYLLLYLFYRTEKYDYFKKPRKIGTFKRFGKRQIEWSEPQSLDKIKY